MKTTVANWFDGKGFGFLRDPERGQNIFAHRNDFAGDTRRLSRLLPDTQVECEVIQTPKGRRAINIKML